MTAEPQPSRQAWFRRLMALATVPVGHPHPKGNRTEAMAGFAALSALDDAIPEATRSRVFEPDGDAAATIVIWHGFTNAPSQFRAVAEQLRSFGCRVLVPRMPYHGEQDVLNRDLLKLTTGQLVDHLDAVVDIAAGFGSPVWVVGLSAGATIAGWAAATRDEISRLVLAAPLVAPVGFPLPHVSGARSGKRELLRARRRRCRLRRTPPHGRCWRSRGRTPCRAPAAPVAAR